MLDKMKTGHGHLGRWVEHLEGKGGESVVAILRFLCGNLRLCRLRTKGLIPVNKYWMYRSHAGVYGPSKFSSGLSIKTWLFPTTSLVVVQEKLGTDPRIGQSVCCGLCQEPFFSGAVYLFKSIDYYAKGCHVCGPPAGSVWWTYVDWREKHTCCIDRVFPVRCTSIQIIVTLGYD
jgi:hypothetical protein